MVETFLKFLQFEKRYSPHTLLSYKNDLGQFSIYLSQNFPQNAIQEVEHKIIRSWIVSLVENKITPRSVNRKIASLRSFYKFLRQRDYITNDPSRKIKILKTEKQLPSFVKEGDIIKLLDHLKFKEDFEGYRDKVLMELLYGTGMRLSEIINAKSIDINVFDHTIKVLGKRNKERLIPFSNNLAAVIDGYNAKREECFGEVSAEDYLIVTNNGKKSYPMFIYRIVRKYLEMFTSVDKKNPHVLRHTFATHLVNKGADLNAVKDLLGHASLAATQVYTHNSMEKLKKVFDQAHPKA